MGPGSESRVTPDAKDEDHRSNDAYKKYDPRIMPVLAPERVKRRDGESCTCGEGDDYYTMKNKKGRRARVYPFFWTCRMDLIHLDAHEADVELYIKFYWRFTRGYKGRHFNGTSISANQPIEPVEPSKAMYFFGDLSSARSRESRRSGSVRTGAAMPLPAVCIEGGGVRATCGAKGPPPTAYE